MTTCPPVSSRTVPAIPVAVERSGSPGSDVAAWRAILADFERAALHTGAVAR